MKTFEYTQDFEGHVKGDKVEYNDKMYCEAQHPLIMRKILVVVDFDRYKEIKAMTKDEQITMIRKLGGDDTVIPRYEDGRIKLIIKLEEN